MPDPIIEIRPSFAGVSLDVNRLIGKLFSKPHPLAEVCRRILEVLKAHDVEATQIQRLFPEISLESLRDEKLLLSAITPAVLEHVATFFGIRQEWLEGVGDQIYAPRYCYGTPQSFLDHLAGLQRDDYSFPVRALFCGTSLDSKDDRSQPLALILVERVVELGDKDIFRYRIYGDDWDWSHLKSRMQIKAMARVAHLESRKPIPLHRVTIETIIAIREGKLVPRAALQGCLLTDPSLEDFALDRAESAVAKEMDELPSVLDYVSIWRT